VQTLPQKHRRAVRGEVVAKLPKQLWGALVLIAVLDTQEISDQYKREM
jgi:hypothetical protein